MTLWCLVAFLLPARAVAQNYPYDVVVYGGGLGGVAAAIQARNAASALGNGANVTVAIFEPTDTVGGQLVAGGVASMDDDGQPKSGILGSFLNIIAQHYQTWYPNGLPQLSTEERVARINLENMLSSAGVSVYYNKVLSSATYSYNWSNNKYYISTLVFTDGTSAGGTGTVFVDASEYGDLVKYGCLMGYDNCRVGNSLSPNLNLNARVQSITWSPTMRLYPSWASGDSLDPAALGPPDSGYNAATYTPILDASTTQPCGTCTPGGYLWEIVYRWMPDTDPASGNIVGYSNQAGGGQTRGGLNWSPLNDWLYSGNELWYPGVRAQTECAAKARVLEAIYYIRTQLTSLPLFWSVANDEAYTETTNCSQISSNYSTLLYGFPPQPYIRESVRGVGYYTLTGSDVFRPAAGQPSATNFLTAIAVGGYLDDFHDCGTNITSCTVQKSDLEPIDRGNAPNGNQIFDPNYNTNYSGPFQVPFESMSSAILGNLVFAEKNISQTRVGNSATRVHTTVMRTGQAAGEIAALAYIYSVSPVSLNPYLVQGQLTISGETISTTQYADVQPGTTYWPATQVVSVHNYMGADPGTNNFGINDAVTRGTAAIALAQRFKFNLAYTGSHDPGSPHANGIYCSDTPGTQYYDYVGFLADTGMTSSCPATPPTAPFGVNNPLTREQLAVFLVRGVNWAAQNTDMSSIVISTPACQATNPPFPDISTSDPFCPFVQAAKSFGLMTAIPNTNGNFEPTATVTKGDLALGIANSIQFGMPPFGNSLQLSNGVPGN